MNVPPDMAYTGQELELFANARNWKAYWGTHVRSYLTGAVLEVGAGIGSNTLVLRTERVTRWVCLEPDVKLLKELRSRVEKEGACLTESAAGTLNSLSCNEVFDVVLYIDVLEHIEDDAGELNQAGAHLRPGGHLIVLSPAHTGLLSAFDASIGHRRRYDRRSLTALTPNGLRVECMIYLDSIGLFLSFGNRVLLRQALPTAEQVQFWDRHVVPVSRVLDALTCHKWGKSILCVWQKV